MYQGQDVVVFEEFRSSFRLEQMLNYLDGHPVELPARYANQFAKFTKVFIVTNIPIDDQFVSFHNGHESEGKKRSWDAFTRRITCEIEFDGTGLGKQNLEVLCELWDEEGEEE